MPQIFQKITHFGFDRLEFPLQFVIRARNQYYTIFKSLETWLGGSYELFWLMFPRVSQSNGINVQTGKLMLATSFSG